MTMAEVGYDIYRSLHSTGTTVECWGQERGALHPLPGLVRVTCASQVGCFTPGLLRPIRTIMVGPDSWALNFLV